MTAYDQETFEICFFETYAVVRSDGSEVELVPGGADIDVTYDTAADFVAKATAFRMAEVDEQVRNTHQSCQHYDGFGESLQLHGQGSRDPGHRISQPDRRHRLRLSAVCRDPGRHALRHDPRPSSDDVD